MGQTQERLTDLDKLIRAQEHLDPAVKQRADEKSVFGVKSQDVSESVDALQRAIVVVSARSDAVGMALLKRQSKTGTAMHRVMVAFLKEQRWRKKVDEMISNFPLRSCPRECYQSCGRCGTSPLRKTAHGCRIQGKTAPVHGRRPTGKTFSYNKVRGAPRENPEGTCLWQCLCSPTRRRRK